MKVLSIEKQRRLSLLKSCGIDVSGLGLINIFFYYDEILKGMGFLARFLHSHGYNVAALKVAGVQVSQTIDRGQWTRHEITITSKGGRVSHEGWKHDQDPSYAEAYVAQKYNITIL